MLAYFRGWVFTADLDLASHDASYGGLPDGSITLTGRSVFEADPGGTLGARFRAPSKFEPAVKIGSTLPLQLNIKQGEHDDSALLLVRGLVLFESSTHGLALTGELPSASVFMSYSVDISPSSGSGPVIEEGFPLVGSWVLFPLADPADFTDATLGDFTDVFAELVRYPQWRNHGWDRRHFGTR